MGVSKSVALLRKKRGALASDDEFGLKRRKVLREEDRMSKLPDEILVSIMSLLTIREAVRTGTLSRRWKSVWISYHGDLDFDIPKRLHSVKAKLCAQERSKYIGFWVKQVLEPLLRFGSSSLSDFAARLDVRGTYRKRVLNKFIEFVMAKRIQKLELDFTMNNSNNYCFPSEFHDWIKQPFCVNRISTLTSLTLKNIDVNGETIEIILSNFPLLARLRLIHSRQLSQLKVSGAAGLNLKHLMIECYKLDILEVSAPNLLSLHVIGRQVKLHVENVPKLVDVSVTFITYMLSSSLSKYFSQFQILLLEYHFRERLRYKLSPFVASYNQLKHLVIRAMIHGQSDSLLIWTSLVQACPLLQKFKLDATTYNPNYDGRVREREIKRATVKDRHPCLKVVELVGFTGVATEVELAIYFVENSSRLEQIIVDRRRTVHMGTPLEFETDKATLQVQQNRALQLKRNLPPRVEFLLI